MQEPQRVITPVMAPQPPSRGARNTRRAVHGREEAESLGVTDFVLIGVIFFLIAAIIAVIVVILWTKVFQTKVSQPDLKPLLILFIIYGACVGAGYLWGRYQSNTKAMKENVTLRSNVDSLQNENMALQGQLRMARSAAATAVAASNVNVPAAPAANVVMTPKQIDPVQHPPSLYENSRDPDDFNDREQQEHPHEKVFPANGTKFTLRSGWHIIGASRRGYGHAYEGKYREDDFNVRPIDVSPTQDIVLVAIADGVSSKAFSRRGARVAVEGATTMPEKSLLQDFAKRVGKHVSISECAEVAYQILLNALSTAREFVEQQAQFDKITVDEMQSTLMVFLATSYDRQRLLVASVQIGDGALFAFQPRNGTEPRTQWSWLQQPQIQAAGNEVQPFMRTGPDMWSRYVKCDLLDNPTFLMGMTDGTADDIEPPRATTQHLDPDPFYNVNDFYKYIESGVIPDPQPADALMKFLAYRKKQSFDDRTVVCLYR